MNVDSFGCIISGGDGGDSCQRMYTAHLRAEILRELDLARLIPDSYESVASPDKTQDMLEIEPGIYIRHPDITKWTSNPNNFSRDQMTPVICYLSYMSGKGNKKAKKELKELLWACLKRGMFSQNTHNNWGKPGWKVPDFILPDLWAAFARGFSVWTLLPLLFILIGDIWLIFDMLVKAFAPINKDGTLNFRLPGPGDCDDENTNNVLMLSQYRLQTPLSWLARKLYKKYRRENYGNTQLGETNHILGAMAWYHRLPSGNPDMVELTRPIVERY